GGGDDELDLVMVVTDDVDQPVPFVVRSPGGAAPVLAGEYCRCFMRRADDDSRRSIIVRARAAHVLEPGFVLVLEPGQDIGMPVGQAVLLVRVAFHVEQLELRPARGERFQAEAGGAEELPFLRSRGAVVVLHGLVTAMTL